MLKELIIHALTPSAWVPGRAKLTAGAVGLWSRGMRCRKAWEPHLIRTKTAIESVISDLRHHKTVAVLGSGSLFDVPLYTLSDEFDQVVLVDLVHLFPVYFQRWARGNVKLISRDLSSAAAIQSGKPDQDPMQFLHEMKGLDLVISVNLLSQLGHGAPAGLERDVIHAHLESLARFERRVVLITDVAFEVLDRAGKVVERFDLLYGQKLPKPDKKWTWTVCPFGEEAKDTERVHTVHFYSDFGKAMKSLHPQLELPL